MTRPLPLWALTLGLGGRSHGFKLAPPEVEGRFAEPPVQTWVRALPGPRYPAASHAERGGPVLAGDYVYLGSAAHAGLLVADRRDGHVVETLASDAPVQAVPLLHGNTLFFSDTSGTTWRYEREGTTWIERWHHAGGSPVLSTPLLLGEKLYIADVDDNVIALDAETGELSWRHAQKIDPARKTSLALYGGPTPVPYGDELLVGFGDGTLASLSARTGEVDWQVRVGEGDYPDIIASPVVRGETAYVIGFSSPLVAMDLKTRAVRWRVDVGGGTTPTLVDRAERTLLVVGGSDGVLHAIDARTGEVVWKWDSGTDSQLSSPVVTDAGLLVGANLGRVYLVDPDTGRVRWTWRPGFDPSGISAPPAVDGRQAIFLTNAAHLVSLVAPRKRRAERHASGMPGLGLPVGEP